MGRSSVIAMLTGLRTNSPASYWKVSHVSRATFIAAAFPAFPVFRSLSQSAAGFGQEYVVEARAAGLDRPWLDPLGAQRAHDLRDGRGGAVYIQPQGGLDGLAGLHARLLGQDLGRLAHDGGLRGARNPGAGQVDDDDVAGELALEVRRGAFGDDQPRVDDRDPVTQRVGLVEVVRGEEDRHALVAEPAYLLPHAGPARRVQPSGRLVQEDDLGRMDHAERHVEAPALAAGVGADVAVGEALELEGRNGRFGPFLRVGFRGAVHPRLMDQVAPCVGQGGGAAGLGHEADVPPHLRRGAPQVDPGDRGLAAVRADQRGQHPERGRLPGAVGTEETEDLAALHGEVHAADRVDRGGLAATLGPVRLAQTAGLNNHRVSWPAKRAGRGRRLARWQPQDANVRSPRRVRWASLLTQPALCCPRQRAPAGPRALARAAPSARGAPCTRGPRPTRPPPSGPRRHTGS